MAGFLLVAGVRKQRQSIKIVLKTGSKLLFASSPYLQRY